MKVQICEEKFVAYFEIITFDFSYVTYRKSSIRMPRRHKDSNCETLGKKDRIVSAATNFSALGSEGCRLWCNGLNDTRLGSNSVLQVCVIVDEILLPESYKQNATCRLSY